MEWNWNDELLSPVLNNIERAFRTVLDEACPTFQANAAQSIRRILHTQGMLTFPQVTLRL